MHLLVLKMVILYSGYSYDMQLPKHCMIICYGLCVEGMCACGGGGVCMCMAYLHMTMMGLFPVDF